MKTTEKILRTPGPWRIVGGPDGSCEVWRTYDPTPGSRNNYAVATGIQSQDDAAAIAALPEILEALENLLASTVANHLPGIPDLDDAQHNALAAIAKARGE